MHPPGTRAFFEEQRTVIIDDGFAGEIDRRIFPEPSAAERVLDLGCGPGFWVVEFARRGVRNITACDLTENALQLARKRAGLYGVEVELSQQNAEALAFPDAIFSHVNCQGVIHHTPDTNACIAEIARVLRVGGTAVISVYHRNIFLRSWPVVKYLGKLLSYCGAGLKGRGREDIFTVNDVDDLVKLYDGERNPIGKAYTRREFQAMLTPHLHVDETFLHFFPARSLPVRMPVRLHRFLDRKAGFLIVAKCTKIVD